MNMIYMIFNFQTCSEGTGGIFGQRLACVRGIVFFYPKDTFEIQDFPIDTESDKMPVWRKFENPPESLGSWMVSISSGLPEAMLVRLVT